MFVLVFLLIQTAWCSALPLTSPPPSSSPSPCVPPISESPFSVRILYTGEARVTPHGQAPPLKMPHDLELYYTRCGTIPVADMYIDDTNAGVGTHYQFPRKQIRGYIKEAKQMKKFKHPHKYTWLYAALKEHSIKKQHVVLFGSMEPWFEAICLAHGAASVTVIEYNKLTYDHPKIHTYTPNEHAAIQPPPIYTVAFAMSSFDHDGLGRYGDALHPDQDLLDMDMVRSMLAPASSGLLFLTVAIGSDLIVWNLGRRYGSQRLPLLLDGWTQLTVKGWNEKRAIADSNYRQRYEPVFVLTPKTSGHIQNSTTHKHTQTQTPTPTPTQTSGDGKERIHDEL